MTFSFPLLARDGQIMQIQGFPYVVKIKPLLQTKPRDKDGEKQIGIENEYFKFFCNCEVQTLTKSRTMLASHSNFAPINIQYLN